MIKSELIRTKEKDDLTFSLYEGTNKKKSYIYIQKDGKAYLNFEFYKFVDASYTFDTLVKF